MDGRPRMSEAKKPVDLEWLFLFLHIKDTSICENVEWGRLNLPI